MSQNSLNNINQSNINIIVRKRFDLYNLGQYIKSLKKSSSVH